jgi:hypothetical protein
MNPLLRPGRIVLALALLLGCSRSVRADQFVSFDYPATNVSTYPSAINNNRVIVGTFVDSSSVNKGFVRNADGSFSAPIVAPNDNLGFTRANGINDAGTLVGDFEEFDSGTSSTAFHGYFLSGGTFSQFDVGGPFSTTLWGINNGGHVSGTFGSSVQANQGFLDNSSNAFTYPGSTSTFSYGTNNSNQIVGEYTDSSNNTHGFLRDSNGTLTPIDYPGAILTRAFGINDQGTIVGEYEDSGSAFHGFFDKGSVFTSYDVPVADALSTRISGINNDGDFIGSFSDANGTHGFEELVPEPGSLTLLSIGVLGLAGYARRFLGFGTISP